MQQGQKSSKKWVDYSDQSEEQFDYQPSLKATQSTPVSSQGPQDTRETIVDHRSTQFIQQQMKRLQEAKQRYTEIWVLLQSEEQWLLDKKMRDLKENPTKDVLSVYMNKDVKGGWDVKVLDSTLQLWIKEGFDPKKSVRVTVSDRNFRKRAENGERTRGGGRGGGRGGRGDRGDRRGRGDRRERGGDREGDTRGPRRERDPNEPKKVYVDKNTGAPPNNKVETEQKIIQEKQRHYTKQEAERVGEGLGNFRNKTKSDNPVQPVKFEAPRVEPPRKPKEDVRPWARKEKSPKNEQREERPQEKKQEERRQEQVRPEQGKKKKQYVLVEKPKDAVKEEKPSKKEKDLLSEDSN